MLIIPFTSASYKFYASGGIGLQDQGSVTRRSSDSMSQFLIERNDLDQ